ncbi:hatching enzyme 1.2-like [Gopherus flavomarginatus]|uniref:hatching enzyme 1.2-like n=1 Tax=Gopherus flavomarginatus TaxID=286002 RepID=UPI0021CBD05C|nr:hatching enzyme 1.2-like [Gopherus flavomarginatus]
MDLKIRLALFASHFYFSISFPIQVNTEQSYEGVAFPESEEESVFSLILKSNKGSKTRLYEGDITPKRHRNAIVCPFNWCFWPKSSNGLVVIPYVISSSYTNEEKALIVGAIQEYETLTCIHFVDRTTETDYIYIEAGDSCWSYFGKVGGSQVVSVRKGGCMRKGIIQHELNHALGMLHEQNRNDRDKYVVISWQYISPGDFYHFKPTRANNLGLKYDYSSVMHYHRFAFSNTSGKATITPFHDSTVPIGQRFGLSNLDVAKINKLYKCVQCGKTLTAMNGKFESPLYPSHYPLLTDCAWIMIAPEGSKISLTILSFLLEDSFQCQHDCLVIYDRGTITARSEGKYCVNDIVPGFLSSGNSVLVQFHSDYFLQYFGFQAEYSFSKYEGSKERSVI